MNRNRRANTQVRPPAIAEDMAIASYDKDNRIIVEQVFDRVDEDCPTMLCRFWKITTIPTEELMAQLPESAKLNGMNFMTLLKNRLDQDTLDGTLWTTWSSVKVLNRKHEVLNFVQREVPFNLLDYVSDSDKIKEDKENPERVDLKLLPILPSAWTLFLTSRCHKKGEDLNMDVLRSLYSKMRNILSAMHIMYSWTEVGGAGHPDIQWAFAMDTNFRHGFWIKRTTSKADVICGYRTFDSTEDGVKGAHAAFVQTLSKRAHEISGPTISRKGRDMFIAAKVAEPRK